MGWAQAESGTQAATLDTEHVLGTNPQLTDGTFVLYVDVNVLVAGDIVIFRFYEKVTGTGETQRAITIGTLSGDQVDDLWFSIPVINIHGGKFTLEQTDGTGRSFKWSIRTIT